jgi:hypothetical protein
MATSTPPFARAEIETAFAHYRQVAAEAASSGNWRPWADLFTENATYVEHLFGTFEGRERIFEWITKTMSTPPNTQMNAFPVQWWIIDEERGWVVCAIANRMADIGDGRVHEAINWTLLKYAGDNLWSSEEDLYNPLEFGEMIKTWEAAKAN